MAPKQYPPFNHDDLVNPYYRMAKPNNQDSVLQQVTAMRDHMTLAEANFTAILETARKVAETFSNFDRVTRFNMENISNLIEDLRTIFRLLRSRLHRHFPEVVVTGQLAAPNDQIPERIRQDAYTCLCPLTLMLQGIAQCLSDLRVAAPSDTGNNKWGTIEPLQRLLVNMHSSLRATENSNTRHRTVYVGLAVCIMLHERHSRYLVTSTAPSYPALKGLDDYGRSLRTLYMNQMREALSHQAQVRVQELESYSEALRAEHLAALRKRQPGDSLPSSEIDITPEAILGNNAAYRTTGDYMAACLLDHLRFRIEKTEIASALENDTGAGARTVTGTTSCAEWEMYVTLLRSPDPEQPDTPKFVAVTYGMPKSRTWETDKISSRPAPTTKKAPTPTPLPPNMPRPTGPRPGQAKSATFANHAQAPPHPAAGQIIMHKPTPPSQPEPQPTDPPKKAKSRKWGFK